MKVERISWIDVARGIGIILVIYAHAIGNTSVRHLIYSFHMPLFFFLSGIVFHVRKYEHFPTFLKKSVRGILFPYFLFAFGSYFLWLFTLQKASFSLPAFLKTTYDILYANGAIHPLIYNVVLWFLPCLFVARVGFAILVKLTENKKYIALFLLLFSLLGYAISVFLPDLKLPFGIETALTAIVFFGVGYLFSTQTEKTSKWLEKHSLHVLPACIVLCITAATINYQLYGNQVDLRLNHLSNYFFLYIASFSGILGCLMISMMIHKQKHLEYVGRHSLILFGWHLMVFSYFNVILRTFITSQTINQLRNLYLAPLYTACSTVVILSINAVLKKLKTSLSSAP